MPTSPTAAAASQTETFENFFADATKQTTDQIIGAVRQSTKFGLDAASAWIDSLTAFLPATPALPFAPSKAAVQQWLATGFDAAENVLALQREIASEVVTKLVPAGQ